MNFAKRIALVACIVMIGAGATYAGINSKEVGALLIYPEYWAETWEENGGSNVDTYITITNDKSSPVNAHIEIIGGDECDDCNFDLALTGFQSKRLWLNRELVNATDYATVIYDASDSTTPEIITACPEEHGFIVAILESPGVEPRTTLGENMLHGDEVVLDLDAGTATQVGAIAVQGVGPNNGDRWLAFNNMEYAAFPSIVTANFWAPNDYVDPHLILFNVNFTTGTFPVGNTSCTINYADAEENMDSRSFNFGCWVDVALADLAPGLNESILGTANGFLWAACDAGTHGALLTNTLSGHDYYDYPDAAFKDTLFQSTTSDATAVLHITPSVTGTP